MSKGRLAVIIPLGLTQTLAWASSYYLPAVLARPVARELGTSEIWFFAAFSASLVLSGLLGPRIGRTIDRTGGRGVLSASNGLFAVGLGLLATVQSAEALAIAWLVLGVAMGMGLYDAAFGALGRIYGDTARGAITGITLIAGFASTVGWPLTALGVETIGWRWTCGCWAIAHLSIGLPLNLIFLPRTERQPGETAPSVKPHIPIDRRMLLLAFAFAAAWTVTSAMAAHLPRLVEALGASPAQAIFAGAMIGPAQVAGRLFEAGVLKRFHPLISNRLACLAHPIGALLIALLGGGAAALFALLHGAGNGILTIARGTVPLAIFGPDNYAYRLGVLGAPSRICQALAPVAFGLLIASMGGAILIVSSMLSMAALAALLMLRADTSASSAAPGERQTGA